MTLCKQDIQVGWIYAALFVIDIFIYRNDNMLMGHHGKLIESTLLIRTSKYNSSSRGKIYSEVRNE